jgi:hypothetical protein
MVGVREGKAAKSLRPSLSLGHLPTYVRRLYAGEARAERRPTKWGAGQACEA